jgi:hypothetical protein
MKFASSSGALQALDVSLRVQANDDDDVKYDESQSQYCHFLRFQNELIYLYVLSSEGCQG